jgi:hypothetical protein
MGSSYSDFADVCNAAEGTIVSKSLCNIKNNVSLNSTQTCESVVNNTQTFSVGHINAQNCEVEISGISLEIKTKVNSMCVQTDNFKELVNEAVKTEVVNLRNSGKPQVANQIETIINNNIDLSKVTKCMSDVYNSQNMNFEGFDMSCPKGGKLTIKNISQTIASDILFTCAQNQSPDLVEKLNNVRVPANEKVDTPVTVPETLTTVEIIGICSLIAVIIIIFIIVIVIIVKK